MPGGSHANPCVSCGTEVDRTLVNPACHGRNPTFRRGHTVRPAAPCRPRHSGPGRRGSTSSAGFAATCGAFGNAAGSVADRTSHSSAFRANPRPSKCTTTISSRSTALCERSSLRSASSLNASSTIPPAPKSMLPTGGGSWPSWNDLISTSNDPTARLARRLRARPTDAVGHKLTSRLKQSERTVHRITRTARHRGEQPVIPTAEAVAWSGRLGQSRNS